MLDLHPPQSTFRGVRHPKITRGVPFNIRKVLNTRTVGIACLKDVGFNADNGYYRCSPIAAARTSRLLEDPSLLSPQEKTSAMPNRDVAGVRMSAFRPRLG